MSKRPNKDPKLFDRNNLNLPTMKKNPIKKFTSLTENSTNKENNEIKIDKIPPIKKEEKTENKNYMDLDKAKDKKFFKFQNMSKLIVNKIDDILGCYTNPGVASSSISKYSDTIGLSKNILENIEINLQMAEENELRTNALLGIPQKSLPSSSNSRRRLPSHKNLKEIDNGKYKKEFKEDKLNTKNPNGNIKNKDKDKDKEENTNIVNKMEIDKIVKQVKKEEEKRIQKKYKAKSKQKTKIRNLDRDVFMTKVEIEGKLNSSSSELEEKKLPEEDELDSSDEDSKGSKVGPELQKEMNDFRNMMAEIESMKTGNKNEFDELQYLIKYVGETTSRVNRHMSGVSNLFKESGIKPIVDSGLGKLSEDSDDDEEAFYQKGESSLYDKEKNIGKIKDNLINMQDNFISYYKNFDSEMKNIESKNTKYKNMLLYEKSENPEI